MSPPSPLPPAFRRFLLRLRREVRAERIVLFGSRGRGDHHRESDFDLLIVSSRFRKVRWVERAPKVLRLWDLPHDLDAICLTPEEFRRRKDEISIIGEAVREGQVL